MGLYAKTIHGHETCAADRLGAEYHAAGRAAALADRREIGGGAAPSRSGIGVRDSGGWRGVSRVGRIVLRRNSGKRQLAL